MYLKSPEEIALIQANADILSELLGHIATHAQVGTTTKTLDRIAEAFLQKKGVQGSFKGFEGYPHVLCTSVNEQVIHGLPSDYALQEGDLLSVDCGVFHQGFHADAAYSFLIGDPKKAPKSYHHLLEHTEKALEVAIENARIGQRIGDIGYAVDHYAHTHGYQIIKDYGGHGLGRELHETPHIPNFGRRGNGIRIQEGLVIALEPLLSTGSAQVFQDADGWTVSTKDKKPAAHFEHTLAIVQGNPKVLTSFQPIKKALYG